MQLNGKTALVTGAASGFGAGIARAFARAGARLDRQRVPRDDDASLGDASRAAFFDDPVGVYGGGRFLYGGLS